MGKRQLFPRMMHVTPSQLVCHPQRKKRIVGLPVWQKGSKGKNFVMKQLTAV